MIETLGDLISFVKAHYQGIFTEFRADAALNVPVPSVLNRFYSELGALFEAKLYPDGTERHLFSTRDMLYGPQDLEEVDGQLEISMEYQGDWTVRCDQDSDDPHVYSNAPETYGEGQGFTRLPYPLSHFLTTVVLQEMVMSSACLLGIPDSLSALKVSVEPLWLNGLYVFGEPSHNFYYSKEHRSVVMDYQGFWVAGESEEVVKALLEDPSSARDMRH